MYLVLTWPFGYCSGTQRGLCKMNPLPQDMTIHGIWPVDSAGNSILSCKKAQDLTAVFNDKTLQDNLLDHWPSLTGLISNIKSQRDFWSYEYNKHGNCQSKMAKDYFWAGISLKQHTSIFQALKDANIMPGQHYKRADFEKAIKAKVGTSDICLRCLKNQNGDFLLKEIYLCIDAQATKVIPCPKKEVQKSNNCGYGTIKFVSAVESIIV
ncbi:unnamed protein product [Dovyalis caffra]|uniref:Uncharacterized protein n=1 Tax=Dovyalis caffra TaxID=77055 RepID=A0AAV1SXB0_9ROSI|nr:unnamed protein product [Dovyalis caffra]